MADKQPLQAHLRCKHTQKNLPLRKAVSGCGSVYSDSGWIIKQEQAPDKSSRRRQPSSEAAKRYK